MNVTVNRITPFLPLAVLLVWQTVYDVGFRVVLEEE